MILLTLLAFAQLPAEQGAEVTVIAQRLRALTVSVGRDPRGRVICALSQSSGNARLDGRLCKTASACVKQAGGAPAAITSCIDARKPALLAQVTRELAKGRAR